MASVIVWASAGLASSSQRRGVTPFVLLLKRSGNISARSLTVIVRSSLEWIAATPLVLCEPTMARLAMRTCLVGPGAGNQKILLHDPQSLSHARRVVGIQDAGQGLGFEGLGHRPDEFAVAEHLEVEVVRRGRGPEPKCVDCLAAVAYHWPIKG